MSFWQSILLSVNKFHRECDNISNLFISLKYWRFGRRPFSKNEFTLMSHFIFFHSESKWIPKHPAIVPVCHNDVFRETALPPSRSHMSAVGIAAMTSYSRTHVKYPAPLRNRARGCLIVSFCSNQMVPPYLKSLSVVLPWLSYRTLIFLCTFLLLPNQNNKRESYHINTMHEWLNKIQIFCHNFFQVAASLMWWKLHKIVRQILKLC